MTEKEFEERLEAGTRKGWVYFADAGPDSAIKVGWAKDPEKRLKELQIGQMEEMTLVALLPGTRYLEADIHRRLWKVRLRGEWFQRVPTMKMMRPVIISHGFFLMAEYSESRTIPGTASWKRTKKPKFFVKLQGSG